MEKLEMKTGLYEANFFGKRERITREKPALSRTVWETNSFWVFMATELLFIQGIQQVRSHWM